MKLENSYGLCGIYRIINTTSEKSYVGSSKNIGKRISEHYRSLLNNKHPNKHLQNSWNKNSGKFIAELVETCHIDDLVAKEQYYISKEGYYNLLKVAYSVQGRKQSKEEIEKRVNKLKGRQHSEQSKRNMSNGRKGMKLSNQHRMNLSNSHKGLDNHQSKSILQYTRQGELVKEWSSAVLATKALKVTSPGISNCISGRAKSCGGYVWILKEENHG